MEKHIEKLLNKISYSLIVISTLTLLYLYLQTPTTCISPETPITKPHLKFPSSTCDPSLSLSRPTIPLDKKNRRLWSSNAWLSQVASFSAFFARLEELRHLGNHSRVLCVLAGAGHEVRALNEMGVGDVTGVELVDSLPLVRRADPNNLPFFDGAFDVAFSAHLGAALFPVRFVGEMERTVREGGVCVVVVELGEEVSEVVELFGKSNFVGAEDVSLLGMRMTRIIMRVRASAAS